MHAYACEWTCVKAGQHLVSSPFPFLRPGLSLNLELSDWPANLRDPLARTPTHPISIFFALGLQASVPSFVHGYWGLNPVLRPAGQALYQLSHLLKHLRKFHLNTNKFAYWWLQWKHFWNWADNSRSIYQSPQDLNLNFKSMYELKIKNKKEFILLPIFWTSTRLPFMVYGVHATVLVSGLSRTSSWISLC